MTSRSPFVTALIVAVGLLAVAFLIVLPRGRALEERRARVTELETELAQVEADVAELEALREQGIATDGIDEARALIPATADLPELLRLIQDAAGAAGVTLTAITPGTPTTASVGSLSSIPIVLSAQGKYFDLARFVFELEHLQRLMKVLGVSVSDAEGALSIQITTEVYTTDTSVGPGSDPGGGSEVG